MKKTISLDNGSLSKPRLSFCNDPDVGSYTMEYRTPQCEFCSQPVYETNGAYEVCCPCSVVLGRRTPKQVGFNRLGPSDRNMTKEEKERWAKSVARCRTRIALYS